VISPISIDVNPSVVGLVRTPVTELEIVICKPSRIDAAPSANTSAVWNGDHFNRSNRAMVAALEPLGGTPVRQQLSPEAAQALTAAVADGPSARTTAGG
jgi:hypothetical protein